MTQSDAPIVSSAEGDIKPSSAEPGLPPLKVGDNIGVPEETQDKGGTKFELPLDPSQKATEFKPFKFHGPCLVPHCGKRRKTNPHMRAFWAATLAFMAAFIGWFAFAPLMTVVRKDIGLCDNDAEVQLDIENTKCICKDACKTTLGNAQMASVALDIFTRFILGSVIEQLGPRNTDVMLLFFGTIFVISGCFVTNGTGLIVVRFFVSCLGSTFVVNQFWNSIMFSKAIVGTANATAGGWGNLGGGLTQTLMPLVYRFWHDAVGLDLSMAWRMSMLFPAMIFAVLASWIFVCTQDTVAGTKFDVALLGKSKKAGPMTYLRCLADYRVTLAIFQYSACFGCELVMNNRLATHFQDYFGVGLVAAGGLATAFGGMNLFARSLGGMLSDGLNKRFGMRGRLWAHFVSLLGQAVMMFCFGSVTSDMGWPVALVCLCVFSTFVNMAEGTTYAIVPYMIPEELPVVSAMVGAGGTAGAIIITRTCFMTTTDDLLPFKFTAIYVLFWAMTVPTMRWETMGSMFTGPAASKRRAPSVYLENGGKRKSQTDNPEAELKQTQQPEQEEEKQAVAQQKEPAVQAQNSPDDDPQQPMTEKAELTEQAAQDETGV